MTSFQCSIWDGELTGETETGINRLLTECRGNLYRVGSELERQLTDLTASRVGLSELVRTTSDLSGLTIQVTDAQGRLLAASRQDLVAPDDASPPADEFRVERELPSGLSLSLGTVASGTASCGPLPRRSHRCRRDDRRPAG